MAALTSTTSTSNPYLAIRSLSSAPTPSSGYDLFHGINVGGTYLYERVTSETRRNRSLEYLLWTHTVTPGTPENQTDSALPVIDMLNTWMKDGDSQIFVRNVRPEKEIGDLVGNDCLGSVCSSEDECRPRFKCLFNTIFDANYWGNEPHFNMTDCEDDKSQVGWYSDNLSWRCQIFLESSSIDMAQKQPCSGVTYQRNSENWKYVGTDANIQTMIEGGVDIECVFWVCTRINETFSESVNRQIRN